MEQGCLITCFLKFIYFWMHPYYKSKCGKEYLTNRKWRAGPLFWCVNVVSGSRVLQHVSVEDLCLPVWCLECCTDLWASLSSGSNSRFHCLRKQIATALSSIQIKKSRKTIMSQCKQKPSRGSSWRSPPAGKCHEVKHSWALLLHWKSSWLTFYFLYLMAQFCCFWVLDLAVFQDKVWWPRNCFDSEN